jgi:hypothetical protein
MFVWPSWSVPIFWKLCALPPDSAHNLHGIVVDYTFPEMFLAYKDAAAAAAGPLGCCCRCWPAGLLLPLALTRKIEAIGRLNAWSTY